MSLPWRKDKRPHLRLVRIEEKLDKLIQLEKGMIPIVVSNDPTEIEIANGDTGRLLFGLTKRRVLHSWEAVGGFIREDGTSDDILRCIVCNVLLTDCGATEDSWYCQ